VIFTISPDPQGPRSDLLDQIKEALTNLRARDPDVRRIVLQPLVGGPGGNVCIYHDHPIFASAAQPIVIDAIDQLVGGDVLAGPDPTVSSCDGFRDGKGHLTLVASAEIAREVADSYR
jgi:hypothetical protein